MSCSEREAPGGVFMIAGGAGEMSLRFLLKPPGRVGYCTLSSSESTTGGNGTAIISLILSAVALGVSLFTYLDTARLTSLNEESIRPRLKLVFPRAEVNRSTVTIRFDLINVGQTPAAISQVWLGTDRSEDGKQRGYAVEKLNGRLVYPSDTVDCAITINRYYLVDGETTRLDRSDDNPSEYRFVIIYSLHGKTTATYYDEMLAPGLAWD